MVKKTKEIPSLKELAAEAVQKLNPHLFFRFSDRPLLPEIQTNYVDKAIDAEVTKAMQDYSKKNKIRNNEVKEEFEKKAQDPCFVKSMGCIGGIFFTGIYLAISIPVLQATEASANTQAICYSATLVPLFIGSCFGMCFSGPIAKQLAKCLIPIVPNPVVDLNALSLAISAISQPVGDNLNSDIEADNKSNMAIG
ncbi:hypothetical protein [Legionella cardiaca]|uniref:Uncharacterized protein n=1 Tax=Legionella cardiaca TaxID=1071983 RepID=A0ABY8ARS1_9GAMM|nr:hypothetical protein [Legionella cardiaca]WED42220.1 hypothetical protein PXX05_09795 [Legionella cardiaca]